MSEITIALAKGRLASYSLSLFEKCGIDCSNVSEKNRKLVQYDASSEYRFIFVKPADVPTYVDRGVADIGIAGKDTLLEAGRPLYEMLDLGFSKCRLCIAGFPDAKRALYSSNLRVATKYPNIAERYYRGKGMNIDIIKLAGSVELGPILNMSDVILDIVESGGTLKANGLEVLETVCESSARLVVNRVSLKLKHDKINALIEKSAALLEEGML
ncbi:MAG: ATP phosphoribosyltransferase [Christensenellales bacterium]|jgi:ATP phosphoribosyltransferase